MAAEAESHSNHPIAQSIREAYGQEIAPSVVKNFQEIPGHGIKAQINGRTVIMGNNHLLHNEDIHHEVCCIEGTVVNLVVDGQYAGYIVIADEVKEDAAEAIRSLKRLGVKKVVMLTGDSQAVAKSVADELGIDQYFAEVLPEHKDQKVAELQAQGKLVAMVGDGVNDAPALTRADVGIAIGGGTDVAIESADIILVQSNPEDVVKIFTLSRASYKKMKENLIWAAGYNVVALPLAAGILAPFGFLLSPAVGAILMSLSTVIVAVNAQLLRRTNMAV